MKKLLMTALVLGFTTMAANAEYLGGFIYNGMTTPGGGYTAAGATKIGEAKCTNVFFIASTGDCSVRTAMRNGKIKSLAGYDVQRKNIMGFQRITTIVWGN